MLEYGSTKSLPANSSLGCQQRNSTQELYWNFQDCWWCMETLLSLMATIALLFGPLMFPCQLRWYNDSTVYNILLLVENKIRCIYWRRHYIVWNKLRELSTTKVTVTSFNRALREGKESLLCMWRNKVKVMFLLLNYILMI